VKPNIHLHQGVEVRNKYYYTTITYMPSCHVLAKFYLYFLQFIPSSQFVTV